MQYTAFFPESNSLQVIKNFVKYDINKILLSTYGSWLWCDGNSKTKSKLAFQFTISDVNEDDRDQIIETAYRFVAGNHILLKAFFCHEEYRIVQQIGTWQEMSDQDLHNDKTKKLWDVLMGLEMGFAHSTGKARPY